MYNDLLTPQESTDKSHAPADSEPKLVAVPPPPPIPQYLQDTYWWAYLHPRALRLFEREWVVNLILWGNMKRLTQEVVEELHFNAPSRVLQVACVYGDFSNQLARHLSGCESHLDIVDVAPIQVQNARQKLKANTNLAVHHQDSTSLAFADDSFNTTVVFFLLHEQPEAERRKTIEQAIRVTRPGGKVIFVDYHRPHRGNPMLLVMKPVLTWLEPFALDLWQRELLDFMPAGIGENQLETSFFFGGLYQKVVLSL